MKKIMFFIAVFFSLLINVQADSIDKITMDIFLDKQGTAHVTEVWDVNITSGTEGYKPYYNLGHSMINNYKVSLNGTEFTYNSNWDVEATFSEKAYKNGINYNGGATELCWGITKYGRNKYTLNYEITGFVSETTDKQMIFWTLIPHELSLKPKQVNIVIRADEPFSSDVPVWGYGNYGGTAYVYDGRIEMNSDGELESNEHMTILVEFPKGTFTTNNILDKNFDDYYNMAEEGATHYEENKPSILFILMSIISIIIPLVPFILITSFILKSIRSVLFKKVISNGKFPKDLNYFREIPCDKDIFYAYFLATGYLMTKNKNDFLGALILKWIKLGYVKPQEIEKKGIFKTTEETTLVLDLPKISAAVDQNSLEFQMFNYMYVASKDGILESKEFSKYCATNYSEVLKWFDDVLDKEKEKATEKGLLTTEKKFLTKYMETPQIYEEAKKLAGLKKFLKEFSSIDDKRAIEVHIWEHYLMYAQIFGMAEKVAEEFKKLYPDVITDLSYNNVMMVHAISHSAMQSADTARSRAQSYSSGGGGFSSGGGGGGSFGGGGGGGGFR